MVTGAIVRGADGEQATVTSWADLTAAETLPGLVALAAPPERMAVLLLRRGGYAVAYCHGQRVVERKIGRRHVQSRTAAGGWSQQRFARRRGNQATELVGAVADHAVRIWPRAGIDALVRGGDRALVATVLADPRLAWLTAPARDFFDLPDATPAVLDRALERARSVAIEVSG